MPSLIKKQI